MTTPFRFAAFDLDGTLVDDTGRLPRGMGDAVDSLRGRGVVPLLVTGRPFQLLASLRFEPSFLDLFAPAVLLRDGDVVWDRRADSVTLVRTVPAEVVRTLLDHGIRDLVVEMGERYEAYTSGAAARFAMLYGLPRSTIALVSAPAMDATKVIVFGPAARVSAAVGRLPCVVSPFRRLMGCFIGPAGVCKAVSVADHLRSHYDERDLAGVVAFGNGENDACLLAACGMGVAVAGSHPDVMRVADVRLAGPLPEFLLRLGDPPMAAGVTARCPHMV